MDVRCDRTHSALPGPVLASARGHRYRLARPCTPLSLPGEGGREGTGTNACSELLSRHLFSAFIIIVYLLNNNNNMALIQRLFIDGLTKRQLLHTNLCCLPAAAAAAAVATQSVRLAFITSAVS